MFYFQNMLHVILSDVCFWFEGFLKKAKKQNCCMKFSTFKEQLVLY